MDLKQLQYFVVSVEEETLEKIKKPSQEAMERCRQHWD